MTAPAPSFQIGDRVRFNNPSIPAYHGRHGRVYRESMGLLQVAFDGEEEAGFGAHPQDLEPETFPPSAHDLLRAIVSRDFSAFDRVVTSFSPPIPYKLITQARQVLPPIEDPTLQELFSACIDGAMATGYQGGERPPAGHWLEFWWLRGASAAAHERAPAVVHLNDWAWRDVVVERTRQITAEGYTHEHDDAHDDGGLADAAACYALEASAAASGSNDTAKAVRTWTATKLWPWDRKWWKPDMPRRMLVKAAALILAEIERIDRAEAKKGGSK